MQITLIWTLHFTVGFEATTVHIGGYFVWVGVVAEQIAGGLAGLGQGVPVMIRL